VSSGRNAIYIVGLSVFCGNYCIIMIIIHVASSCERKGVRLYGKFDYYLILLENRVGCNVPKAEPSCKSCLQNEL
jgi:hypothetical protein